MNNAQLEKNMNDLNLNKKSPENNNKSPEKEFSIKKKNLKNTAIDTIEF